MKRAAIKRKIWQNERYYQHIATIDRFDHPGFLFIKAKSKTASAILDVGCGDGSKLSNFGSAQSRLFGCDISSAGIARGKKLYPQIKFSVFDGLTLPYEDNFFDLVTTMFVLEHTSNPEPLINEMVRVTKIGGYIAFLAPNFGAPNRASPNFVGSRWKKLACGLLNFFLISGKNLNWQLVEPKALSMDSFTIDSDTTVEPYVYSLQHFVKNLNCHIVFSSSYWEMEQPGAKFLQRLFKFLGTSGLAPFKYFGPHLFVFAQKK